MDEERASTQDPFVAAANGAGAAAEQPLDVDRTATENPAAAEAATDGPAAGSAVDPVDPAAGSAADQAKQAADQVIPDVAAAGSEPVADPSGTDPEMTAGGDSPEGAANVDSPAAADADSLVVAGVNSEAATEAGSTAAAAGSKAATGAGTTDRVAAKAERKAAKAERKAERKRRRSPLWAKLVLVLGVLLMLTGGGAIAAVAQVTHTVNKAVPQADLLGDSVAVNPQGHVSIDGPINILLVGLDTRPDNVLGTRADSIIIAHIPASHDQVYLTSIPRDTQVDIPADKATGYSGGSDKINASFLFGSWHGGGTTGGFQLLAKTIKQAWHIEFQAAAMINFDGFKDIITKLGGISMYVDEKTTSIHHGIKMVNGKQILTAPAVLNTDGTLNHWIKGVTPIVYTPGVHFFTAWGALDYVRARDLLPNADYDRERHQQQLVFAVLEELYKQGLNDPTRLTDWLTTLGHAYVFSGGGIAPTDWIWDLKAITPQSILMIKTNNGTYNTIKVPQGGLLLDEEVLSATSLQLLAAIRTDTVPTFIQEYPSWLISPTKPAVAPRK